MLSKVIYKLSRYFYKRLNDFTGNYFTKNYYSRKVEREIPKKSIYQTIIWTKIVGCNDRLISTIDQHFYLLRQEKRKRHTSVMKCAHTHGGFGHTFTIFPPWDFCRPRTNTHYAPPAHVADVPFYVYSRMRFLPRFPTIRQFYPSILPRSTDSTLASLRFPYNLQLHIYDYTSPNSTIYTPNYSKKSFILSIEMNNRKGKIVESPFLIYPLALFDPIIR